MHPHSLPLCPNRVDPTALVPTWFAARERGGCGGDRRCATTRPTTLARTPLAAHRELAAFAWSGMESEFGQLLAALISVGQNFAVIHSQVAIRTTAHPVQYPGGYTIDRSR